MKLTKSDSIEAISRNGMSKFQSAKIVNSLLEIIKVTLEGGDEISIRGFGKFRVCDRSGLNSKTSGQSSFIPMGAKRVVTFRCSPALGDKINGRERKLKSS